MTYSSLRECCTDLERKGYLLRIKECLDPDLVIPELHRRVFEAGGPALLFERIQGSPFQAVSNIYGTQQRAFYLFEQSLRKMDWVVKCKMDPATIFKEPLQAIKHLPFLSCALPKKLRQTNLSERCKISDLPKIRAWPRDGGSFITLPQVISFPPASLDPKKANVGMYRIQLDGNQYLHDEELGLHYQLHRGIGIHHQMHNQTKQPFRISIGVGGPPGLTLASIFPLPDGLSEILFSGLLTNRRYRYCISDGHFIPDDVDFCITGMVTPDLLKEEGPFGDHLGYYSLKHPFPVLSKIKVFHRPNPLWHFTVVGRPPQEDSFFGSLIHEFVKELTRNEFPGILAVHAVDVAGVHPLLLALGSERYMPFRDRKPEEIITQALHLLGKGQTSLAKYLFIAAQNTDHPPDIHDVPKFLQYILERIDLRKDLHFLTRTTMDTLDYSGSGWNAGSKLMLTCNRHVQRKLSDSLHPFLNIPSPFRQPFFVMAGILIIEGSSFVDYGHAISEINHLTDYLKTIDCSGVPLLVLVDDSRFVSANVSNFLWVSFTRSNPSHDLYGVHEKMEFKHWGCDPPLIIDARSKPHHAPILETDPATVKKVDQVIEANASLQKIFK